MADFLFQDIRAINDADSPVHSFSFAFDGGVVENELIENEKTNEKLIIGYMDANMYGKLVSIKRSAKETINSL